MASLKSAICKTAVEAGVGVFRIEPDRFVVVANGAVVVALLPVRDAAVYVGDHAVAGNDQAPQFRRNGIMCEPDPIAVLTEYGWQRPAAPRALCS